MSIVPKYSKDMLDTNLVSYLLKGKFPAARRRISTLEAGAVVCISVVTEAELLHGIAKSGLGEQRKRLLEWFLLWIAVHPWGRDEAACYGPLRAQQEAAGTCRLLPTRLL